MKKVVEKLKLGFIYEVANQTDIVGLTEKGSRV